MMFGAFKLLFPDFNDKHTCISIIFLLFEPSIALKHSQSIDSGNFPASQFLPALLHAASKQVYIFDCSSLNFCQQYRR